MIKEIIPKVGKRAKFVQKYEEYKENLTERPAFGELQLDEKVTLANTFFSRQILLVRVTTQYG